MDVRGYGDHTSIHSRPRSFYGDNNSIHAGDLSWNGEYKCLHNRP